MERKLKQKSFSDVLEEAIKQRWGTKRKTPLVNFPRSIKKCKVQSLGYSTSQQDSQGTSTADHESFSQSQPVISEKKLSPCAKQTIRGWKPPLKRYQEIIGRNATDVNSTASLKLPENNSVHRGYLDGNDLQENYIRANSVNCEAKNNTKNVPIDKYAAHKVNSVLSNSVEGTKHVNKDSLQSTSLAPQDDTGSIYQDITQTSNIQQCIKTQCSSASVDSVAHENTPDCIQSSTFIKEAEMENPTSLDQSSNESKEYELAISTDNGNNNTTMIESIANSEDTLSNANTETDLKSDDILCLSQQSTQPYIPNDSITHEENTIIVEEETEKSSNSCEAICLSPKANIFENPSYLTDDIHNEAINASYIISDVENEDMAKDSTLCSVETIPSIEEEKLSGKEIQDTLDSKGFKKFLGEKSSESRMFSHITYKSGMARNQQNGLVSEQNDDTFTTDIGNSFNSRRNYTNRENITCEDSCASGESTVITKAINSMEEENTNKECEKGFCTETTGPQSCDEISTHTHEDIYASTDKYSESKMLVFDAKKYTKTLEAKFRNVFHFGNYLEETPSKEIISVFDNNEKPPITDMNITCKQDMKMKTSENHNACMAAVKLNDSNVLQRSEDTSFLEVMKTDKSKDDTVVSTVICDGSSVLKRSCKSSEHALKCTELTAKESFNKEMTKAESNAFVSSVESTNLQMNQSTLKFNDPNNIKSVDVNENVLTAIGRRNDLVVPDETEPMVENSNIEEETVKYQQTLEVPSQSNVNNDGKIHSEDKDKNKLIVFNSQSNDNEFVFETETLTENNSEGNKFIKCQGNINLETETVNSGNKFSSEPAIINSETSHPVEERACIADLKLAKENLVEDSGSSEIEKYVFEMKTNHSRIDSLKDGPEDIIYTACLNSSTKKINLPSTNLTDQIFIPDIEVKNDCEILNNSKTEQYSLKNETEKKTGELIMADNKESGHIGFKNHAQAENKNSFLIPDTAMNNEVAAKNNNNDFSEMEDDFGLTVSQILRIEDECQQKMFMPEMPSIQWAQKVKESRRKVQAVIQEITKLNAMLKKARKEVWQPQSDADSGEGTSAAEDFNTLPRPISHRWNRNLSSKSGKNMQRK